MKGTRQLAALAKELETSTPPCVGDWRFIADRGVLDDTEIAKMQWTCRACPLSGLCREYAAAAHPRAGFWAGKYWAAAEAVDE